MQKLLFIFTACCVVVLLAGCGHTVGSGFKGKMINLGYDPETNKLGVQYWNGVFGFGGSKENTEISVTDENTDNVDGKLNVKDKFTFKHKTGIQVNGYTVKALEKCKPEDLHKLYHGEK